MIKCDYKDICATLGPQLQVFIKLGKLCHPIIMNILTCDDDTKDSNLPELGELVTLFNEVMPHKLINSPRAIDPTVGEDCPGVIRSEVEEGSADVDQSHFVWTDIGRIIRMLQELVNNGQDSTLGESSIQHVTYILCHHSSC